MIAIDKAYLCLMKTQKNWCHRQQKCKEKKFPSSPIILKRDKINNFAVCLWDNTSASREFRARIFVIGETEIFLFFARSQTLREQQQNFSLNFSIACVVVLTERVLTVAKKEIFNSSKLIKKKKEKRFQKSKTNKKRKFPRCFSTNFPPTTNKKS